MSLATGNLRKSIFVFHSLKTKAFLRLLLDTLFSMNQYYILGRSLAPPLEYSFARMPKGDISPLTENDITYLRRNISLLNEEDRRELLARLFFYESGFTNCYVMRNGTDIAYLQWIIFPSENRVISQKYSTKFNLLSDKQVMIENAFTFPNYRGRGYLPFGTQQLLELAKRNGYSSAICYIRTDRITSLNEFTKMGFKIVKMVDEYKLFGKAWRTL